MYISTVYSAFFVLAKGPHFLHANMHCTVNSSLACLKKCATIPSQLVALLASVQQLFHTLALCNGLSRCSEPWGKQLYDANHDSSEGASAQTSDYPISCGECPHVASYLTIQLHRRTVTRLWFGLVHGSYYAGIQLLPEALYSFKRYRTLPIFVSSPSISS